jgi:hypothetical protein
MAPFTTPKPANALAARAAAAWSRLKFLNMPLWSLGIRHTTLRHLSFKMAATTGHI